MYFGSKILWSLVTEKSLVQESTDTEKSTVEHFQLQSNSAWQWLWFTYAD